MTVTVTVTVMVIAECIWRSCVLSITRECALSYNQWAYDTTILSSFTYGWQGGKGGLGTVGLVGDRMWVLSVRGIPRDEGLQSGLTNYNKQPQPQHRLSVCANNSTNSIHNSTSNSNSSQVKIIAYVQNQHQTKYTTHTIRHQN